MAPPPKIHMHIRHNFHRMKERKLQPRLSLSVFTLLLYKRERARRGRGGVKGERKRKEGSGENGMGRNGRKKRMGEKMDLIVTRDRMRGGEQAITIFGHTLARVLQNLFFSIISPSPISPLHFSFHFAISSFISYFFRPFSSSFLYKVHDYSQDASN